MHNLDMCEVTVLGEELNQEQESLEIDMTRLQQKGIEMSSSNLGMIITGGGSCCCSWGGLEGTDRGSSSGGVVCNTLLQILHFLKNFMLGLSLEFQAMLWKAVILEKTTF